MCVCIDPPELPENRAADFFLTKGDVTMEQFFAALKSGNDVVNTFVWTTLGLVLLLATGLLTTIITKCFQVSHFGLWWKNTIGSLFNKDVIKHDQSGKAISPFQALCTALAATIGVGNIAGVAAAICTGGPGAVFWMWVAAFQIGRAHV